jgi:ADP-ribose pyrophosphatase YjhB (NUDIX family)
MGKSAQRPFNPKKEVSVMAWIEDEKGAVLFVRQALGRRQWTLPGGKVKQNESLKSALTRELHEETGLVVANYSYRQFYDRPKRGAITMLFRVMVKRLATRLIFPTPEIAEFAFFNRLPTGASPSARFFWKSER